MSQSTGDELRQCLDVPLGRIDIVLGGVDSTVFHSRPATEIEAIRARLGIPGPYLLFVGLVHPHKRLDWLVEHLVTARSRMPSTARLVAVGGHAEKFDAVHRQLVQHQATDFVVFAGRVSDAQLAALYSGATAPAAHRMLVILRDLHPYLRDLMLLVAVDYSQIPRVSEVMTTLAAALGQPVNALIGGLSPG